jgi:protein-tyrosine phosphatase
VAVVRRSRCPGAKHVAVIDDPRVHWAPTNLRELGGYETADGRRVKQGVLFRSGRMDELDEPATAIYRHLGLHTIVDLRRLDEVEDAPTPAFGHETNIHLSVSHGDNTFAEAAARIDEPEAAVTMLDMAGAYYTALARDRLDMFVPVFEAILAADGKPVLFHCTAGKDRTGFVAAALLAWLGVDERTVMDDYMFTAVVRAQALDERVQFHRRRLAAERGIPENQVPVGPLDAMRTLMSVDERMLQASIDVVNEVYGDWHELRRTALGISDDRLNMWADSVLED